MVGSTNAVNSNLVYIETVKPDSYGNTWSANPFKLEYTVPDGVSKILIDFTIGLLQADEYHISVKNDNGRTITLINSDYCIKLHDYCKITKNMYLADVRTGDVITLTAYAQKTCQGMGMIDVYKLS